MVEHLRHLHHFDRAYGLRRDLFAKAVSDRPPRRCVEVGTPRFGRGTALQVCPRTLLATSIPSTPSWPMPRYPPSTLRSVAVMNDASSLQRKRIVLATSRGSAQRRSI